MDGAICGAGGGVRRPDRLDGGRLRQQWQFLVLAQHEPGDDVASGRPSAPAATTVPPFAAIVEPFDPGHPAQAKPSPADCGSQPSTLAIEQCYEANTENTDAQIDTVQQGLYNSASSSAKSTILAQDSAWLAARGPVCKAAFNTGGTIDGISIAACLLDESTARLDAVKNIVPPEAKLKSTDSTDPNDLSWYTTPEGSRMAEIDTQGDQTGGAVISWVIVGGAQGFVINPKQFFFQDGSFTDPGIIEADQPDLPQGPDRRDVPVRHRLLHAVQRPERRQGQRRVRLRARHPGRRLAVTKNAARAACARCAWPARRSSPSG